MRRKLLLSNGKQAACLAFGLCMAPGNLNVEAIRSSCHNKS